MGRCVLREWVVGGGGLDGYFGEQGLPVGIQKCLERWVAWIAYSRCGRIKVLYRGRKILGVRAAKDRFK